MKPDWMQLVRLAGMVVAVAGIIWAIEFLDRGIAVWFWVTLLALGFVGLLYTYRLTQRRNRNNAQTQARLDRKRRRKARK